MNKDKNKNKGFTLIELLVVILIIAVLAGIVFAQYQKSILKSRFSTLVPIAKALNDGQEMFLLSHGKYADRLENLDVEIAAGASGNTANINGNIITLGANKRHTYIKVTKENFDNNLIMFQAGSKYFPGEIHCEAKTGKILANWLCKVALNGKEVSGANADRSLTEGYTDYVINGEENGFFPKDFKNLKGEFNTHLNVSNGDSCTGDQSVATTVGGCSYVDFSNDSTCYGNTYYACQDDKFSDSTCYGEVIASCRSSAFSNNSLCVGGESACIQSRLFIDSTCEGNGSMSCMSNTFTNSTCYGNNWSCLNSTFNDSTCYGNGGGSCSGSTFKGSSSCYGDSDSACAWNGYSGVYNQSVFEDNSSCYGNTDSACKGVVFKDNSICYANEDGACGGSVSWKGNDYETTYEGNACCSGEFCPSYAPKCDCGIDANTGQHALSC